MRFSRTIVVAICLLMLFVLPSLAQETAPPAEEAAPAAEEPAPAEEGVEEADSVLLRLKYQEGETLTYETTVDGVGSVHVMGQTQAIDMTGTMQMVMKVEEIDDEGNFTIVTGVDVAELTVTMNGSPVQPPNQDITMRTKMTPRGEILDIQMEQSVDQSGTQSPWNSQMAKMLTGGFDLNRMLLGQKMAAFPEEAVNPGDEWTGDAPEVELRGETAPLEITTKYDGTIELEGRTCARLDSAMCMQPSALGELATMLSMEGSTTTQTRTWFDIEAGRALATMEKTQVSMQVSLPAEITGAPQAASVFLEMFVDTESKLLPTGEEE